MGYGFPGLWMVIDAVSSGEELGPRISGLWMVMHAIMDSGIGETLSAGRRMGVSAERHRNTPLPTRLTPTPIRFSPFPINR